MRSDFSHPHTQLPALTLAPPPPHPPPPPNTHSTPAPPAAPLQDKLLKKAPYSQYEGQLAAAGAQVLWGSPTDPAGALPAGARFDIVYDNNGKDMDACKPLIDHFKVCVFASVCVCDKGFS